MNEEIYEGSPAKEDVLIGTDSGYNRYKRPDGSTYIHYPYSLMATVTAYSAKDKNGQPIRTADGKLITGKTQAEANRNRFRYDMNHWVEANRRKTAHLPEGWRERIVTPDMDTFNAITGGVFTLTPIQVGRGIYNLSQGKDPGFILGNSGVVSKEYAQEHPWLALGANVLGEGLTGGFIYGAPKLYNNIKSIHKHLNTPYKNISINGQVLSDSQINPKFKYLDWDWLKFNYLKNLKNTKTSYFTDKYGKEIIPTPYKGSDDDLIDVVIETHKNTLKDYFTNPKKIELIKKTMNWGDAEINELRSELMRTLGKTSKVEIKGLEDGFNNIALHQGTLVGTGKDARMLHTVTLNKDRIPNILMAEEGAIHEVGAHGKTASMNAANFGKGGNSDLSREAFPRLAELVLKNKELADLILVLNRKGRLLNSVNKPSGLELHFDKHNIPWERYPKYQDALKRFRYVASPPEIEARAYTGQLFERLHPEAPKTTNILLLEEYFTPESVENFKKAVLGISPIIGLSSLQDNNKTESKKRGVN